MINILSFSQEQSKTFAIKHKVTLLAI